MYVCTHVCVFVCVCVRACVCVYIHTHLPACLKLSVAALCSNEPRPFLSYQVLILAHKGCNM